MGILIFFGGCLLFYAMLLPAIIAEGSNMAEAVTALTFIVYLLAAWTPTSLYPSGWAAGC